MLRIVNGFCIAGLTATIESWLNTKSSNETRGRVLGFYMLTFFLAIASGQSMVNLADVGSTDLFMLAVELLSVRICGGDRLRNLRADPGFAPAIATR